MRFDAGRMNVASAGTRVLLSSDGGLNTSDRILWAQFKGLSTNTGIVWVGIGDVAATHGFELLKTDTVGLIISPRSYGGSIGVEDINFDAGTNGDDVVWALLLE